MEILYAGIPIAVIVGVVARIAWKQARQDRADIKALKAAREEFNAKYEWKPRMVDGIDRGDWVRKDGRPRGIDDD
jgi:hypothetical protein